MRQIVLCRVAARGIAQVATTGSQRIEGKRHVFHAAAEGPHLVERAAEGHHTIAADDAIGGLHAHHATQGRRLANGTTRVGPKRQGDLPCRHRRRAATRRPAWDARGIPRVVCGVERRRVGGRAKGELVHVELAQRRGAGIEHALHARGGIGALVGLQHAARAGGARTDEIHVVLEAHRHARQRRQRPTCRARRIRPCGRSQGEVLAHLQKRPDLAVTPGNGVKGGTRHLGRAETAGGNACRNLPRGELIEADGHAAPPSARIAGTRKRRPWLSGALARAS